MKRAALLSLPPVSIAGSSGLEAYQNCGSAWPAHGSCPRRSRLQGIAECLVSAELKNGSTENGPTQYVRISNTCLSWISMTQSGTRPRPDALHTVHVPAKNAGLPGFSPNHFNRSFGSLCALVVCPTPARLAGTCHHSPLPEPSNTCFVEAKRPHFHSSPQRPRPSIRILTSLTGDLITHFLSPLLLMPFVA